MYLSRRSIHAWIWVLFALLVGSRVDGQAPGWKPPERIVLNNYYFSATSAQGAVGDVVAIEVFLTVDEAPWNPYAETAVACFDPGVAEIVGEPVFSEEFEAVSFLRLAYAHRGVVGPVHAEGLHGFTLASNLLPDLIRPRLQSGVPLSVGVVYFRLVGEPGEETEVRFCDGEFQFIDGSSHYNDLSYNYPAPSDTLYSLSERHVSGTIRVLPGEPTQTELPTLPPAAKVYAEPPTPECGGRAELEVARLEPTLPFQVSRLPRSLGACVSAKPRSLGRPVMGCRICSSEILGDVLCTSR